MNQRNKQRHVFTVSHQNGFSSSIQSASNLSLVRIRYLYADSVLNAVYADFLRSEGPGGGAGAKTLVGRLKLSLKATHQRKLYFSLVSLISLKNF